VAVDFGFVCNIASAAPRDGGHSTFPDDNRRFLRELKAPFNAFWMADHLQIGDNPMLEAWTSLCVYAAEFPALRCGTIVLGQSYRNPALLAKMAASLQWLTGGRLILGIGAGWKEDEYRAYGYEYPLPATRIGELEESVQIIRKLWTESPASFQGKYYSIANAVVAPHPNPLPPILVGGGGEQLTLRVVAKHADWWNLPYRPIEEYGRKLAVLREQCARVGRDPQSLTPSYLGLVSVAQTPAEVTRHKRLYTIAGTPDEVAAEVQGFIDLGVRHFMLHFLDFPHARSFELFQDEVIPRLNLGVAYGGGTDLEGEE
jgi:alkanesulfonate monooxygenase SsuD/methylene tetrahydromethanopterin reductase-like flavin-dependent oxidoreductase (luciferase family)